ncbi:hypothetical protein [Fibrobacter succinogenes]|uniref:Lipoprotein n=1 Tax=Fibrobacter succinogenes TaxID=833 RepID=A0A380RWT3_FIBSU|nr:hypothetical protein [Fibrobacter succinogenes]PWJ37524.1 hypothetical protein IE02_1013 [Fibrobacter succinogenes subsp. elongatus]SUQ19771.1 hypothetical protein SAMN05661053_1013 [Fibrobacter succinogenes]
MKKLSVVACSAFAALMFVACSVDPVTAAVPPAGGGAGQGGGVALDSTRNISVAFKGCFDYSYNDALKKTAVENPKAYLVTDDAEYHVVIPDMAGTCGYENIVFNNQRVLDTLKINFEGNPAECRCINDVWFNIDPLDADIKYLVYLNTVYEIVAEPLLERSSSSELLMQSSSSDVAESSSSVVSSSSEEDPSRVIVTDANVQCEDRRTLDPLLDGNSVESFTREKSDAALPPVAYRYVSTENVGFTIKNVTATCNVTIDSLEITTADNTIYVNAKYDFTNAQRCLCRSEITFSVKIDPAYNTAEYLVLNDGSSTNFNNKMEIVDLDVIRTDDIPNNDF